MTHVLMVCVIVYKLYKKKNKQKTGIAEMMVYLSFLLKPISEDTCSFS